MHLFSTILAMNLMLLLSLLLVGVFADEERIDDGTVQAITEKLWHEIKKRLGDLDLDEEETDLLKDSSDKCFFDKNANFILMTHDSIENGAEFIVSPHVQSDSECFNACCGKENCNVAVFKEKQETACYLFNCGTNIQLCNFTAHPGFSVTKLPKKKVKVKSIHEDDLAKLVKTSTTTVRTTTTSTTTTTPAPTTTTSTTTLPPPTTKLVNQKPPAKLFGKCEDSKDCAGASTECLAGYCVCQDGYHNQDDECRKDCSRFEFECANTGQPLGYPQCIAIYDTCDGVVHCSDQSDERNCPKNQPEILKSDKQTSENDIAKPQKPNEEKSTTSSKENQSSSTVSHQEPKNQIPDVKKPEVPMLPVDEKQQENTTPAVVEISNPVISKPKPETTKPVSQADPSTENLNNSAIIEPGKGAVMEAKVQEEEESEATSIIQSNQGAVIALALGLTVTALLLVFVGCRLRNMKRRLRRGRPLDSNEADYLINGMYL